MSWLEQTDIPVCIVRYEDMKADTVGVLANALRFAGEPADGARHEGLLSGPRLFLVAHPDLSRQKV